ncbi:streptomycin biosynthesis protein [Amycolatopsis sp. NPDC051071]|uniref:ParB/RepB/Spo0J family partition protein n=1 Tax=Amycolatopsis sp. NPDC051071 TaxID=3154637 RepID=UPI0034385A33
MDRERCGEAGHAAGRSDADTPSIWHSYNSDKVSSGLVPVSLLRLGALPRVGGVDDEHVDVLAKLDIRLPPIIVHRPTMRVIDGAHRLRAAELGAREHIEARFFDGDEHDAFVLAVEANTANGLPLSLTDRKMAAARIILTHPNRSDRWIAQVTGLAATTIGSIRKCSSVEDARSNTRIGRDGRLRPLDSSDGRRLAGELLLADPNRSLRDIAKAAGIAPSTVLDVRNRLGLGKDLVPAQRKSTSRTGTGSAQRQVIAGAVPDLDPVTIMQTLRRDPSLRFSEAGRALLRWLEAHIVASQATVPPVAGIPGHCLHTIADLARHNARFWAAFSEQADELEHNGRRVERAR